MVGAILWPQIGHPLHEHMSKLVFPLQRHISTQFVCSGGKHFVKWVAALTLALWPGHSDVPSALLLGPWPAVATYGIGSEWSSWHDSALQCTHSHKKIQVSCTCTYIRYITYRRPYHTTHTHTPSPQLHLQWLPRCGRELPLVFQYLAMTRTKTMRYMTYSQLEGPRLSKSTPVLSCSIAAVWI